MSSRLIALCALAVCLLVPTAGWASPPSPELEARMAKDPALKQRVLGVQRAAHAAGVDSGATGRIEFAPDARGIPSARVDSVVQATGDFNTLAILVDFSDKPAQMPAAFFDSFLFADVFGPASLRGYWREVSYGTTITAGKLAVTTEHLPSSTGWKRMPQPASYYLGAANGMGNYPNNSQKLVEEAVAAADAAVDFSRYDNDHDGYVDNVIVIASGTGAQYTGALTDFWSHQWSLDTPPTRDGVKIKKYAVCPEWRGSVGTNTVGTYAHEMGHVLGLPDLYDYDNSSAGVGTWSLMSTGGHNGSPRGSSPARPDAWSMMTLGWLKPQVLGGVPATRTIAAADSGETAAYIAYPRGLLASEYFLVENRRKRGTDSALAGEGLLVWHVDAAVAGDYGGNDNEAHKGVDLEEASGIQELDSRANSGSANDPFPGTSGKTTFTDETTPDARRYSGERTGLIVDGISASAAPMSARMGFGLFSLEDDAAYIGTSTVVARSYVTGMGEMCLDTGSGPGAWRAFTPTMSVDLEAGEGTRTVRIQYRASAAATQTFSESDDIRVDLHPPVLSFAVAGGRSAVPERVVTATVGVSDASPAEVQVTVDGAAQVPWTSSPGSPTLVLPSGDGTKSVTAWARDLFGRVTSVTAPVYLDTVDPVMEPPVSQSHPDEALWYRSNTPTISWDAADAGGVAGYSFVWSTDPSDTTPSSITTASTFFSASPSADGIWHLWVRAVDRAGRWSAAVRRTVRIDAHAPVATISAPGPLAYARIPHAPVKATASDVSSVSVRLTGDARASWTAWQSMPSTPSVIVAGAEGTKTVLAQFRDAAGNVSEATCTVFLDTVKPTVETSVTRSTRGTRLDVLGTDWGSGIAALRYRMDGAATVTVAADALFIDDLAEGPHHLRAVSVDRAGNESPAADLEFVAERVAAPVTRISGADRYAVAAGLARAGWDPSGTRSWPGVEHVIVANGETGKEADPLAAAGLAGAYDAPVLLTQAGQVPRATLVLLAEIAAQRKAEGKTLRVHLIGGTASVPDARWNQMRAIPGVSPTKDRLAGADRYQVSANIARRMIEIASAQGTPTTGAIVVAADDPAAYYDALAASPIAFSAGMPMLSVKKGSVPSSVMSVVNGPLSGKPVYLASSATYVAGPAAALGPRLSSTSARYASAASIASAALARGWLDAGDVGVAAKLPDALTGGAFIGKRGGVLLFTGSTGALQAPTSAFVSAHAAHVDAGWVLGGTASVPSGQEAAFRALVR